MSSGGSSSSVGGRPRPAGGLVLLPVQHLVLSAAVPLFLAVAAVLELLHRDLTLITGGQATWVQAVRRHVNIASYTG